MTMDNSGLDDVQLDEVASERLLEALFRRYGCVVVIYASDRDKTENLKVEFDGRNATSSRALGMVVAAMDRIKEHIKGDEPR